MKKAEFEKVRCVRIDLSELFLTMILSQTIINLVSSSDSDEPQAPVASRLRKKRKIIPVPVTPKVVSFHE